MANEDEGKQGGGDGGSAGDRPTRGDRPGRNRGERSSAGKGGAPSNRELEAAIANLPPERLAALLSIGQARSARGPSTPKISHTLDKLDAEEARAVIAACDEAIDAFDEGARERKGVDINQALAPIRDVNPEVVAAMMNNSAYRNKPVEHSVRVTRTYLASKHGDDTQADVDAASVG